MRIASALVHHSPRSTDYRVQQWCVPHSYTVLVSIIISPGCLTRAHKTHQPPLYIRVHFPPTCIFLKNKESHSQIIPKIFYMIDILVMLWYKNLCFHHSGNENKINAFCKRLLCSNNMFPSYILARYLKIAFSKYISNTMEEKWSVSANKI